MDKLKIRRWYMIWVALIGAVVTVVCAYRLPGLHLEYKFAALALITVLLGSQITIKIPSGRGQIAVSDTFIFLAILLFGVEAAVVLAAVEALCSSFRFSKKASVLFFNSGVMALSTFITASDVFTTCFRESACARASHQTSSSGNYNALKLVPYKLSISIGVAQMDSDGTQSMEDLMAMADLSMYENKRGKQNNLQPPEAEVDPIEAVA